MVLTCPARRALLVPLHISTAVTAAYGVAHFASYVRQVVVSAHEAYRCRCLECPKSGGWSSKVSISCRDEAGSNLYNAPSIGARCTITPFLLIANLVPI